MTLMTKQHRRKPSSYQKPKKKGHKHKYEADSKGNVACRCGRPFTPKAKDKDPKAKVRVAAHTKKRMPPPQRLH